MDSLILWLAPFVRSSGYLQDGHETGEEVTVRMIDGHCHLADNAFKVDVDDVIGKAIEDGVRGVVVVSEYSSQFERVMELATRHPKFVGPSLGIHPIQKKNKSVKSSHLRGLEEIVEKHSRKIVSIGEIGLDFTDRFKVTEADMVVQKEVLDRQLELATRFSLPINVHSRSSSRETLNHIRSFSGSVLLHAFDGDEEAVREAVSLGCFFSLPPAFTTTTRGGTLVAIVPPDRLLLESDSPALGVVKGRNTPSSILTSAQFISAHTGRSLPEVIELTTNNALRLFTNIALL